ncbi:MAG: hypothetical protein DRP09_17810, partial [Candidatus Thorarchaeota archaeon]
MSDFDDHGPFLESIIVKNLFGIYNYEIDVKQPPLSRTTVVFGRNGTGKTTLLKLLQAISQV